MSLTASVENKINPLVALENLGTKALLAGSLEGFRFFVKGNDWVRCNKEAEKGCLTATHKTIKRVGHSTV